MFFIENKIYTIIFAILTIGTIVFFSYRMSRASVSSDVKLPDSIVKSNEPEDKKLTRFETLKGIWSEAGLTLTKKDLEGIIPNPIKTSVTLKHDETINHGGLAIRLGVIEKTHKMGHTDTHNVLLHIENKTKSPLAFRILTKDSKSYVPCISGGTFSLHTFLLKPLEKVTRREGCAFNGLVTVQIDSIQTVTLTDAAYLNLGRITNPPGLNTRLKRGHRNIRSQLPPCILPDINGLDKKISENPENWSKIIKFFAQNDCASEVMP